MMRLRYEWSVLYMVQGLWLLCLALVVGFLLSSCSLAMLPKDATPEQKRTAYCQDVQACITSAQVVLSDPAVQGEKRAWYVRYLDGVQKIAAGYCGG